MWEMNGSVGGITAVFRRRLVPVVCILIITVLLAACGGGSVDPAELRGGETRRTLSPAYFTGKVAKAYRIAREIPDVIDSLYCYCECKKNFGHKSLLTCYVDTHARYCKVCIDEALMAYSLHKKGKDIVSIRRAVDRSFSH